MHNNENDNELTFLKMFIRSYLVEREKSITKSIQLKQNCILTLGNYIKSQDLYRVFDKYYPHANFSINPLFNALVETYQEQNDLHSLPRSEDTLDIFPHALDGMRSVRLFVNSYIPVLNASFMEHDKVIKTISFKTDLSFEEIVNIIDDECSVLWPHMHDDHTLLL